MVEREGEAAATSHSDSNPEVRERGEKNNDAGWVLSHSRLFDFRQSGLEVLRHVEKTDMSMSMSMSISMSMSNLPFF